MTITAINAVLNVLRRYTNPWEILTLPADFTTAVGEYPHFDIDEKIDDSDAEVESDGSDIDSLFGDDSSLTPAPEALRIKMTDKENRGVLIYFGIRAALQAGVAKFDASSSEDLKISINADGLPLFRSSVKSFWPILGRFGDNSPFEIGLYYGRSKPRYSNKFYKKFVDEFKDLEHGFILNNKAFRLSLKNACFDSPARSFSLNSPYFNAREACHKCEVVGVWMNNRMCFLDLDAPPRTRNQFYSYLRKGETKSSELLRIDSFDPVIHCQMDPMHVVELGVMRKLLKFWTKNALFCLSPLLQRKLSDRLKNTRQFCPKEFQRKPREIKDCAFYKAKEYRAIVLYLGPIIFESILPKKQYQHFLYLHIAYRILNDEDAIKCKDNIEFARNLLYSFVADFKNIYLPQLLSYVVHALLHLADDVERFGTAISISAYAYESRLGYLGGLVRSGNAPAIQVARRIYEMNYFGACQEVKKRKLGLDGKSSDGTFKKFWTPKYTFDGQLANRYCQIDNKFVFLIRHFEEMDHEPCVVGAYIEEISSVYKHPCHSIHFDTVQTNIDLHNVRWDNNVVRSIPVSRITGKYYCVPMHRNKNDYAFVKLLH